MNVEIPLHVRDTATQLGAGVPYALKVLAGQLADDPDMGRPSDLPGILTVTVDGDLFEDCPALAVGYIREPDRIEIPYVNLAPSAQPVEPAEKAQDHDENQDQDQDQSADPAAAAVTVREVADAWQRITGWLQRNAPDSYAVLRDGVSPATITALADDLGIQIPADLSTLWSLTAGDDGVSGAGCLPGNQALMALDAVAAFYRQQMDSQAHQDTLNARRPEYDRITVWKPTWIPVFALGPADSASGLYVDAASGYLGRWSRYNEGPGDELDTLATYLEGVADMLGGEKPRLWPRGTSPAWSAGRWCGAAGSTQRWKTGGSL
ncbi:hypothetical protein QWM81_20590 [Streptomyces ficellus]|uniref:Knr4/Smi1-like domain-containing protein n=1 Tax=Streptomyces ficellus TaxID=1977088 RepID=A0ABT7ZA82_9ACTN|nr:hypothetical protein [Streptomyces ficellus]MDN3296413.1 hypothetical protein [Streptomyces ficellus]